MTDEDIKMLRDHANRLSVLGSPFVAAAIAALLAERDAMDELRRSCAQILGTDPETWPNHGNAPLAIAAALALRDNELKRLAAEPERVPLTEEERRDVFADAAKEWSALPLDDSPGLMEFQLRAFERAIWEKCGIGGGK